MGDVFYTAAKFSEDAARVCWKFIGDVRRKGVHLERSGLSALPARGVLASMVLEDGALRFSDRAGTKKSSLAGSIWMQTCRAAAGARLDDGLSAVVDVWERASLRWDRDILRSTSVRISMPRDVEMLIFDALRSVVESGPPDSEDGMRRSLMHAMMDECVTLDGKADAEVAARVRKDLMRPLLPHAVRRSEHYVQYVPERRRGEGAYARHGVMGYDSDSGSDSGSERDILDRPAETPIRTPTETPLDPPTETSLDVAAYTPLEDAADTPLEVAADTPLDVAADTPLEDAGDTPIDVAADTPIEDAEDTPIDVSAYTPLEDVADTPLEGAADTDRKSVV